MKILSQMWRDESGQDVAEYALMLAVILIVVVGTVKLIGTEANTIFGNAAQALSNP